MQSKRWQPAQMVQLMLNRGYLENDQVLFARARALLDGHPNLLKALMAEGLVDEALVERVTKEVRQDELVRGLVATYNLLDERELAEAHRLQRGSRRTLAQTMAEEGLGSPRAMKIVLDTLAGKAAPEKVSRVTAFRGTRPLPQGIA